MTERRVHYSRLLDFVSGSAFAAAKTKVQKSAIYKDFDQSKLGSRFRELISDNLPAFYVVDLELVVREILDGIKTNYTKVVSSVATNDSVSFEGDTDFKESVDRLIDQNRSMLEKGLLRELQSGVDSIKSTKFSNVYYSINSIYEKLQKELSNAKGYIAYRNAAIRAGFELRKLLSTVNVTRLEDGAQIVALPSSSSVVIIGPTFSKIVTDVNKVLADKAKAFLESNNISFKAYSNVTKEGFYIGQFINAGHTAAFGPNKELIGVNMPSAQEVQFALGNSAEAIRLETDLSKIYADVNYEINFTQNYSANAKTLLNMQFSFVITMPARLNTVDINTAERARIAKLKEQVIVPSIQEALKNKFTGGVLDIIPDVSASPTLKEFVKGSILSTIAGKVAPKVLKTNTAKANQKMELPVSVVSKKKVPITAKKKSTQVKMNIKSVRTSAGTTSLAPLQSLLDSSLFEQVKKNMGTGSAKNVLNYRTGRLAASAKVERLSESREGMITAFYTYMKNPYATFSEGGLQSRPKTRDPKLLISKSIRELGATLAYNRMRAVLV